ncbi:MAG: alkene reductase [Pseudomonadota bacterium]
MSLLFTPARLGRVEIPNRAIMAPMTRSRASAEGIQTGLAPRYYAQRAAAGLIISEAIAVSRQGHGYPAVPGLWNDAQQQSWKNVFDAVHSAGGRIAAQIFHTGRSGHSSVFGETAAPSPIAIKTGKANDANFQQVPFETPRELETAEIPGIARDFAAAARRAIDAGADAVEIHGANSYLIDEFLRSGTNKRTDIYGQDRTRFLREVVEAVASEIGADRTGVRFSPMSPWNDMSDQDPLETFRRASETIRGIAFMHLVEMGGAEAITPVLAKAFGGAIIVNGGYDRARAEAALHAGAAAVAFGVPYLANPDLLERLRLNASLNTPDPGTFYGGGEKGYSDYPVLSGRLNTAQQPSA